MINRRAGCMGNPLVRFCGRLEVKFLRSTRLVTLDPPKTLLISIRYIDWISKAYMVCFHVTRKLRLSQYIKSLKAVSRITIYCVLFIYLELWSIRFRKPGEIELMN